MSEVPDGLYYTKEHEWIRVEGDEVVIGITDHAQDALTDIVYIELPEGCEAQVRPRSGLAFKNGITVLNSPGTIDADYRGELGVILINHSNENFIVKSGDRIAQLVISKFERVEWESTEKINSTLRGSSGFGSTGSN